MMDEQGSNLVPMADLGYLSEEAYTNYCADLCERVLSDENFSWEDAANLMFGPEPEIAYTRWSA